MKIDLLIRTRLINATHQRMF